MKYTNVSEKFILYKQVICLNTTKFSIYSLIHYHLKFGTLY